MESMRFTASTNLIKMSGSEWKRVEAELRKEGSEFNVKLANNIAIHVQDNEVVNIAEMTEEETVQVATAYTMMSLSEGEIEALAMHFMRMHGKAAVARYN